MYPKICEGWILTDSHPQVMAAQVILGVDTEEPNKFDFEFLAKFIPLYPRFFSDLLFSSSSSSSSPFSGYGLNTYSGK
jgi:hypothetical protein